jgi:hypothetical protein
MAELHEVMVLCDCEDIECCRMERYIADVRIAFEEIERLSKTIEQVVEMAA